MCYIIEFVSFNFFSSVYHSNMGVLKQDQQK